MPIIWAFSRPERELIKSTRYVTDSSCMVHTIMTATAADDAQFVQHGHVLEVGDMALQLEVVPLKGANDICVCDAILIHTPPCEQSSCYSNCFFNIYASLMALHFHTSSIYMGV
eukprot:TRINITY_DN1440_c0_g2_i2.p1 TRINITY_DN1440_c0_g2~~TRINITY_DN1440_c0_g2_i2.p1  ORF type:complete len:114 (-),score=9.99 TRINITY_DN1440_c0_g2_i2:1672-2013(-)